MSLGCKKHIEEQTKIEGTSTEEHVTDTGEHVVTTTTTEPSKKTTDVYVYRKPETRPDGGVPARGPIEQHTRTVEETGKTVTLQDLMKQQEDYGLKTEKVNIDNKKKLDSGPSFGCTFGFGVWGIAIVLGLVIVGYLILKAKKVVS